MRNDNNNSSSLKALKEENSALKKDNSALKEENNRIKLKLIAKIAAKRA